MDGLLEDPCRALCIRRGVDRIQGSDTRRSSRLCRYIALLLVVGGVVRRVAQGLGSGHEEVAHRHCGGVAQYFGVDLRYGIRDLVVYCCWECHNCLFLIINE